MLNNLLKVSDQLAQQGYPKEIGIGEAAIYPLLGFVVVFVGIAFLIFVVWLVGKIMTATGGKTKEAPKQEKAEVAPALPVQATTDGEELSEETIAVITAAIMAYYTQQNKKCEFTVKRIKRI